MSLLPKEIKEQLPQLYANEELGLMAQALVKFFTPDAQWTWYASEFDGEDIFFGLVIGFVGDICKSWGSNLKQRHPQAPRFFPI